MNNVSIDSSDLVWDIALRPAAGVAPGTGGFSRVAGSVASGAVRPWRVAWHLALVCLSLIVVLSMMAPAFGGTAVHRNARGTWIELGNGGDRPG
jgi:hypothetical protein